MARAQSPQLFSINVAIGTRLPAFRTSMGKVLLSELHETVVRSLIAESTPKMRERDAKIEVERVISDLRCIKKQGYATSVGEMRSRIERDRSSASSPAQQGRPFHRAERSSKQDVRQKHGAGALAGALRRRQKRHILALVMVQCLASGQVGVSRIVEDNRLHVISEIVRQQSLHRVRGWTFPRRRLRQRSPYEADALYVRIAHIKGAELFWCVSGWFVNDTCVRPAH